MQTRRQSSLTLVQNTLLNEKLSEYQTGYRPFSRTVLESIYFEAAHGDFGYDNEMVSQILYAGYRVAEITCPTNYFREASMIGFWRSVRYGFGVLRVSSKHFLRRAGFMHSEW